MKIDQENPTHRVLVGLAAAALVTFALWGVWMAVATIIGGAGWLANKLGDGLLATMRAMWSVHVAVAWVGVSLGVVAGAILALNVRVDRVWSRLKGGSRPADGNAGTA